MEFVINGRNLAVSDRFREYAAEKVDKIEQLGDKVQRVDAKITKETSARDADTALTVELTVLCKGPVIRAEATAGDKFAAFDLAYNKLLERLRRARDRRKVHHGRHTPVAVGAATAGLEPVSTSQPIYAALADDSANGTTAGTTAPAASTDPYESPDDVPAGDSPVLIRRKVFSGEPITLDDAVDNMELVGHDFYLFVDSATGAPSVVYRRQGWTYGVITLDSKCAEGTQDPQEELLAYRAKEAAATQ
ncbi:MAG: Ribosome hibernation promoting factor Hpf [uncultured Arthrobacter sp.]|uniref:Ribosome hibernation promoting factor n=1 Tax=uncultured Arthrobacter sp. TaxID=114050 RepID=A0A6J4HNK3_9MICC|nr:ribosome-associated translation inhibitor RaiA [uncultured Arthrobacter sp.]CAA9229287.1 MAG: Ribosome hibernation promoting factor Hpf [uncultured Arthrobacter sp.]